MLLLPLLPMSYFQRQAAFITCVTLMPVLLEAASLLQADDTGVYHHQPHRNQRRPGYQPPTDDDTGAGDWGRGEGPRQSGQMTPVWLDGDRREAAPSQRQGGPDDGRQDHHNHGRQDHSHNHHQHHQHQHHDHQHHDHQHHTNRKSLHQPSRADEWQPTMPGLERSPTGERRHHDRSGARRGVGHQTFNFRYDSSPPFDLQSDGPSDRQRGHISGGVTATTTRRDVILPSDDPNSYVYMDDDDVEEVEDDDEDDDYLPQLQPRGRHASSLRLDEYQDDGGHDDDVDDEDDDGDASSSRQYESSEADEELNREQQEGEEADEDEDDEEAEEAAEIAQASGVGSRLHGRVAPCPGCQRIVDHQTTAGDGTQHKLTDKEMKDMLIERIKQQILLKLRLTAPPTATQQPHAQLPEPLIRGDPMLGDEAVDAAESATDDPDDFYGKTTQIITFATQVNNCPTDHSTSCFHFDLHGKVDASEVKSAELWVYKEPQGGVARRPHTLVFSRLVGQHHNSTKVGKEVGHTVARESQGWIRFDLKRLVGRWLNYPERNLGMAVHCKTCRAGSGAPVATTGDRKPLVIVHTTESHQLYRRSTNECTERSSRCCREKLRVNFSAIGWNWITWPPTYDANYCKGTCFALTSIIHPKNQHTNIMQTVAVEKNNEELAPCCAPRKMSGLSMIYLQDGDYVRKLLPNMAVESCGCT